MLAGCGATSGDDGRRTVVEWVGLIPEFKTTVKWVEEDRWDDAAHTVTMFQNKLGRAVRTGRFRYAEWDEGRAGRMLFDEARDPHELKNLAEDPAHAKTVREMKKLLKQIP